MVETNETERLLGTLVAKLDGLEQRMDRAERYDRERRQCLDSQIAAVLKDVEQLRDYMIENRGGKKALVLLLAAAGSMGAFIVEAIQRLMHIK